MQQFINFKKNGTQLVNLPFAGISKIEYQGKCPITGIRLYECDTGNDPRGPLGFHAIEWFVATEHGMKGKDFIASWIACNNDQKKYEQALALAKKQWT